jgi:hypothetical protein
MQAAKPPQQQPAVAKRAVGDEQPEPVVTREGLSQVEAVPFTLVTLRLRRDQSGLVALINDKDWFRGTEDITVEDALDLPTKLRVGEGEIYVHFGDKYETLQHWEPAPADQPQWQLQENTCSTVNELKQGRWPDTPVAEDQAYVRKDLIVLRRAMLENLMAKLGELAKASVGRRGALVAAAVQLEVRRCLV